MAEDNERTGTITTYFFLSTGLVASWWLRAVTNRAILNNTWLYLASNVLVAFGHSDVYNAPWAAYVETSELQAIAVAEADFSLISLTDSGIWRKELLGQVVSIL